MINFDKLIQVSINEFLLENSIKTLQKDFQNKGYVVLRNILNDNLLDLLYNETEYLLQNYGKERNFLMEQTGNSLRKMKNVKRNDINEFGEYIPLIYNSKLMRALFGKIVKEEFLTVPYTPEEYIVNALYKSGDTHGWHWDDYKYGIVYGIDTPKLGEGGFVQVVPNTEWDKENPNNVELAILNNPIYSFRLNPGDAYILRTDTGLHRVHPLNDGSKRVIINMVWSTPSEINNVTDHNTMEELFA